jgi:nicotinamide mononucleotide transporter
MIDVIGALLSLISAYFYIKERSIAWLISLLAIPFDIVMDFSVGVYGDLFLQFVYLVLLLYGWYKWRRGENTEDKLLVRRTTLSQVHFVTLIVVLPIIGVWLCLTYYTNSEVALLDATVTVLSITAIYLLSQKIIESWLLWVFIDILYFLLFMNRYMPFHAIMSLFDAAMCIIGYSLWVKEYAELQAAPALLINNNEESPIQATE